MLAPRGREGLEEGFLAVGHENYTPQPAKFYRCPVGSWKDTGRAVHACHLAVFPEPSGRARSPHHRRLGAGPRLEMPTELLPCPK